MGFFYAISTYIFSLSSSAYHIDVAVMVLFLPLFHAVWCAF